MVAAGIVYHPALIVGGGLIASTALVKALVMIWEKDA